MNLTNGYWYTYGVQVTPTRIAWFVDGVPGRLRTDLRPCRGIPLTLRLHL